MTAPKLTAAAVDGATLTLIYNEPLKATSPEVAAYMAGVSGGSPFTLSDVQAGVGPGNTRSHHDHGSAGPSRTNDGGGVYPKQCHRR